MFWFARNLHRCRRTGEWKFFCEDHRKQPLVWLFVGIFTVGAGTASILSYLRPSPSTPIRPSQDPANRIMIGTVYTIHIYNVDDIADLYINERVHYKVRWGYQGYEPNWFPFVEYGTALINSKPGDSQVINITSDLQPGDNTLRFTLWDSGISPGAASLSVSGKKNGQELIVDSISIPHYTTPRKSSRVYERTFHIRN